ncbi:MAG: hypothetical protein ACK5LT_12850, partial [Lachnospirales bacterium]
MVLRALIYTVELLKLYIKENNLNLLRRKAVKIPKPEIYILYNGKEKNKETEINLSKNFYN